MIEEHTKCPRCGGCGYLTAATATIGDLIQTLRVKKGLSQLELAMQVGVSRAQISNIESGRTDPQVKQLRQYAEALGCTIKDLIP